MTLEERFKKRLELFFDGGIKPKNNYGSAPCWFVIKNVCDLEAEIQMELAGHCKYGPSIFYPSGMNDKQEEYLKIRLNLIKSITEYKDSYEEININRFHDPESVRLFYKKIVHITKPLQNSFDSFFLDAVYQVLIHWRSFYGIRCTLFEALSALKNELKVLKEVNNVKSF
jgi:hypothetical protein